MLFGNASSSDIVNCFCSLYWVPQNEDFEWDEFGNDLYAIPDVPAAQPSNPLPDAPPTISKVDEDSKIKALIETPALDWQR